MEAKRPHEDVQLPRRPTLGPRLSGFQMIKQSGCCSADQASLVGLILAVCRCRALKGLRGRWASLDPRVPL